jgi:hypothetical protein
MQINRPRIEYSPVPKVILGNYDERCGVYQNYKTRLLHIGDLVYIEDKFVKYILNFKIIFDYKVKNKRSFGACKIVGNYLLKMLNFIIL